jgi:large subunit ribosomal protein L19
VNHPIIDRLEKSQEKKRPKFSVGDRLKVSIRLKEGDKERIQVFRGLVISKHPKSGKGSQANFTIRKISEGVGVERIFPLHSPVIEKIEVESSSNVRRSRLYYLRSLEGKKARLKESERFGEEVVAAEEEVSAPVEVAAVEASAAAPVEAETAQTPKAESAKPDAKKE